MRNDPSLDGVPAEPGSDGDPWPHEVGKFVMAFGDIEHTTVALLGCFCGKKPIAAAKMGLADRFTCLEKFFKGSTDPLRLRVIEAMSHVAPLVEYRNFVAHNTIWYSFYTKGDAIQVHQEMVSPKHRDWCMRLPQMRELADNTHRLAREFTQASSDLMRVTDQYAALAAVAIDREP